MVIAGEAVVTAGDDAHELAVRGAVVGDGHGGVAGALLQLHDLLQGHVGSKVGVALDEASLVVLDRRTMAASVSMVWEP